MINWPINQSVECHPLKKALRGLFLWVLIKAEGGEPEGFGVFVAFGAFGAMLPLIV